LQLARKCYHYNRIVRHRKLTSLFDDDNDDERIVSMTMSVSGERSGHPTFSGKWLAGTTTVTSPEGDDVTLSCIFSGRCVVFVESIARLSTLTRVYTTQTNGISICSAIFAQS